MALKKNYCMRGKFTVRKKKKKKKSSSKAEYVFYFLTSVLNYLEAFPANARRMVTAG